LDPLLTAEDVSRLLKVKISTVYDGVYRGLLPAVRLWKGRRRSLVRFRQADREAGIQARPTNATKSSAGGGR